MSDQITIRRPGSGSSPVPVVVKEDTKYPCDVIPLPTKGYFYPEGHPLSCGSIELKQMTAREEDILANQELMRKGTVLDKLIESLIVDKSIKSEEILTQDKNAILIAIRRLAYGDNYPINVECPRCSEPNRVDINLGEIKDKEIDFSKFTKGENSFSFTLPQSKKVVTFKLLNEVDTKSIEQELTTLKKLSKEPVNRELTTRLKYIITSVDGNADKQAVRKFVDEQLLAKDSLALRQYMREIIPNVDLLFDFKCQKCDHERRMDVPLGATFLWPDLEARG